MTNLNASGSPMQTAADLRQRIWTELERAVADRHHAWRTPVLATVDNTGLPDARTVVMREADARRGCLCVYTDARSPKVAQLFAQPHAMLVFWSQALNWQLRVLVSVTTHLGGPEVDAAWGRVGQSAAAGDYLSPVAPGSVLPPEPAPSPNASPMHHLAVLNAQVQEIDWLELARTGHRRARFCQDTWEWLAP